MTDLLPYRIVHFPPRIGMTDRERRRHTRWPWGWSCTLCDAYDGRGAAATEEQATAKAANHHSTRHATGEQR